MQQQQNNCNHNIKGSVCVGGVLFKDVAPDPDLHQYLMIPGFVVIRGEVFV